MRKKQERLKPHGQGRPNSDSATPHLLRRWFLSSDFLLFLYQCSSACICGFKAFIQPRKLIAPLPFRWELGEQTLARGLRSWSFHEATMPPGARVQAARSRAADSRCETRVRRAGACRRTRPGRAASNRFRPISKPLVVRTMVSRRARASSPGVLGAIRMHVPFSPPRPMRLATDEVVRGRIVRRARSPSR